MKTIFTLFAFLPLMLFAQGLVDTNPQNKSVLLEQFTGVNCGSCPEGLTIAENIKVAHEGKVVAMNIHAGGFAVPSASQIDFRTSDGDALNNFYGITPFLNGVVGRIPFNGALTLGGANWPLATEVRLLESSPVNLGVMSSFNAATRDLTVDVEIQYTAAGTGGNDYVSVFLLESGIIGEQIDYSASPQTVSNYEHNHALRSKITPDVWGDEITISTMGHNETRQYTITVPAAYDISNCEVVAFIGEYQGEVYQVKDVKADGGTTLIVGYLDNSSGSAFAEGTPGNITTFSPEFTNTLGVTEDYVFTLSSSNAPANWSGSYTMNGLTYTGQTTLNMTSGISTPIDVNITPGATIGIADYVLTATSVSNPNAPVLSQEFHVISGVSDLIIDNAGAEQYGSIFDVGLTSAGQAGASRTTVATAMDFATAGALNNVLNIYYNVSLTFPAFSDDNVAALQTMMDNGKNLFISGQDIGWDVMSNDPNSNGTPAQQSFYENYLLTDFVSDGSTVNNSIEFIVNDGVYGWTPGSAINNLFGSNSSPEELNPRSGAQAILNYNGGSKIGGVRGESANFKVVYLGLGLEQFSNPAVAHEVVKRAHDWFYGAVSTEEFDAGVVDLLGNAYPVPANTQLTIPVGHHSGANAIQITDAAGRLVNTIPINGLNKISVNINDFSEGAYIYQLISGTKVVGVAKIFQVSH